jgi:class 3 adenylate cyclase
VTADSLVAGRAALAAYDWEAGYALLTAFEQPEQLTAQDLEALGEAAFWVGRPLECIRFRESSFALYNDAHLPCAAARVAMQLVWAYFMQHNEAVASGWLAKAKRLLNEQPECHEHGLFADALAHLYAPQGKLEEALKEARSAFAIGQRLDDADLQASALNTEGAVLLRMGEIAQGTACIDESMASAIGGGLAPWTTATIYCTTISACQRVGDLRRATQWTDAAEQCAHRPGMRDFPGDCRFHRIHIQKINGHWDAAEAAADQVTNLASAEPSHVATVHEEIGSMRVNRGRYDAAEEAFRHAEDLGRSPQLGRALLCLAQGDIEAASSFLSAAALAVKTWDRPARARLLPSEVEIALAAGRINDARRAADELLDIAAAYGTVAISAASLQAHGRVLGAEGDVKLAETTLHESIRVWSDLPAPFEAARSRLALAEILSGTGRADEAQIETRAALTAFERLGAEPDALRARRMLEEFDKARSARNGTTIRATRTFMFTDIVGSTNLLSALGDAAWQNLLRWHDQVLRGAFSQHGGEEIDHAGDGFFVAFESVDSALDCAIMIQQELTLHRQEHGFSPAVRIGAHLAEATSDAAGYSGKGVHHAARIGALAEANEILVSHETIETAESTRSCSEVRSVELKGIAEPCAIVSLRW